MWDVFCGHHIEHSECSSRERGLRKPKERSREGRSMQTLLSYKSVQHNPLHASLVESGMEIF